MKIKVETLEEVLGEVETEERFEIILPFLKKISELEEKNEALERKNKENLSLLENPHNSELKFDILKDKFEYLKKQNEELEKQIKQKDIYINNLQERNKNLNDENRILSKNVQGFQDRISNLKTIFESMNKEIPICYLYENIKEIGNLLDVEASGHVKAINAIEGRFRKMEKMKSEIEEFCKSLKSENEQLKSEKEKLLKNIDSMNSEIEVHAIKQREYNEELREKINMLENENKRLNDQIVDLQRINRNLQEVE